MVAGRAAVDGLEGRGGLPGAAGPDGAGKAGRGSAGRACLAQQA